MDEEKINRLVKHGFQIGTAAKLLALTDLEMAIVAMRDALNWYANRDNYEDDGRCGEYTSETETGWPCDWENDRGQKAREALEELSRLDG